MARDLAIATTSVLFSMWVAFTAGIPSRLSGDVDAADRSSDLRLPQGAPRAPRRRRGTRRVTETAVDTPTTAHHEATSPPRPTPNETVVVARRSTVIRVLAQWGPDKPMLAGLLTGNLRNRRLRIVG